MAANPLPVLQGISAAAVRSIPDQWSAAWFRRFVTNYLQPADVRNGTGVGISITGNNTDPVTLSSVLFTKVPAGDFLGGPVSGPPAFPTFRPISGPDLPGGFTGFANPGHLIDLTTHNGVATTAMRSDAAPALDVTISPTMTGLWEFAPSLANQAAIVVVSSNAPTHGNADVAIVRAGSTANAFGQGPNVQLSDSTGATFSMLQQSGGQTELWQGSGGTQHQLAFWNSGRTLTLAQPNTNQAALIVISGNSPTTGNADVTVQRAGSTAGAFAEGPNIQLVDSVASTFTVLQQSGGNTELWQGVSATRNLAAFWNSNRTLTLMAPASGQAALIVNSGNSPTTGNADVTILRAGSTANAFGEGANLQLVDSVANTFTDIQQSGGQTEFWVGTGATRNQAIVIANNGVVTVNAQTAGSFFGVNGNINGVIAGGVTNSNAGASAGTDLFLNNGTNALALQLYGTGFTGTPLTGGPTGQQALLASTGAIPLSLGANQIAALTFNSAGTTTFNAPAAAGTVVINGQLNQEALLINAQGGAFGDCVITGSSATHTISGGITNTSTGAGAATNWNVNNSVHTMVMEMTSTGFTGSIIPGSPTGEAALLASNGAIPLMFGSNHTYAGQINPNGGWQMNPTAGIGLQIVGVTGSQTIVMSNGTGLLQNTTLVPSLVMNSVGVDFCMLQNDASQVWSIAVGGLSTALGTPLLQWGNTGQFTLNTTAAGVALNVLGSSTGATAIQISNGGSGSTGSVVDMALTNGVNGLAMQLYGTGFTGTPLTSGPAGQQAVLASTGSIPLLIGANQTAQMKFVSGGGIVVNPPTTASSVAFQVNGTTNGYVVAVDAAVAANQSFGLLVNAGTNANDICAIFQNATGAVINCEIRGDGQIFGLCATSGGLNSMSPDTGTFTASATGFTTTPTCTCTWYKMGRIVTLNIAGLSGTSNATTFTLTGLPAVIQVATTANQSSGAVADVNAGAQEFLATVLISAASGTITISRNESATGWTATGTKALNNCTITYQIT